MFNGYEIVEDLKDIIESYFIELNIKNLEDRMRLLLVVENFFDEESKCVYLFVFLVDNYSLL